MVPLPHRKFLKFTYCEIEIGGNLNLRFYAPSYVLSVFYYCQVPALQFCNYTKVQLQEISHHEMFVTMFPNLSMLASICLTIPVLTASVERSFSQMKMIKTRLRNCTGDSSLNHLMFIAIESPDVLTDNKTLIVL